MRGAPERRSAGCSILLVALLAAGCGPGEPVASAPESRKARAREVPAVRLDQPRREGPEDLAGALPVPPGAREAEAPAWARGEPVAYASATSPEEVAAFYREALLASGWALDGVTEREGRLILVLSTPSLRSPLALRRVTIAVEGAPGGSRFAVWERHAPL